MLLADAEGGAADEVHAVHRLLDHRGGRVVPGAGVLGAQRVPGAVGVGTHVRSGGLAALGARQVVDVDRGEAGGIAGLEHAALQQAGRTHAAGAEAEHRRKRGAAGIRRQPAIRLEGVREIAVVAAQDGVALDAQRAEGIPAILVEVAVAEQQAAAVDVTTAFLGHVDEAGDLCALVVALGDEVDHAADRVGAVDRRCAVAQHLDALDRGERDGVEVDRAALQAMGGDAAPVEQHQRGVGALAAEVGARHAVVAAQGVLHDAGVAGEVVGPVAGDVEVHQQLLGGGDALGIDLLLGDRGDGQRLLDLDALDARTGDGHLVEGLDRGLGVLRPGLLGHGGQRGGGERGQQGGAQAMGGGRGADRHGHLPKGGQDGMPGCSPSRVRPPPPQERPRTGITPAL